MIVPGALSSIVSFSVFCRFLPKEERFTPLFGNHLHYSIDSALELLPLTALAVVLVLVGIGYIKSFYGNDAPETDEPANATPSANGK